MKLVEPKNIFFEKITWVTELVQMIILQKDKDLSTPDASPPQWMKLPSNPMIEPLEGLNVSS